MVKLCQNVTELWFFETLWCFCKPCRPGPAWQGRALNREEFLHS